MDASYGTAEMSVYITPGGTFLCAVLVDFMPSQGMFIDYLDAETSVTTRYRVEDVFIQILETPSSPIPQGGGSSALKHHSRLKVEVTVVP